MVHFISQFPVCFEVYGTHILYSLEVPGLAENRPSVVVGMYYSALTRAYSFEQLLLNF